MVRQSMACKSHDTISVRIKDFWQEEKIMQTMKADSTIHVYSRTVQESGKGARLET